MSAAFVIMDDKVVECPGIKEIHINVLSLEEIRELEIEYYHLDRMTHFCDCGNEEHARMIARMVEIGRQLKRKDGTVIYCANEKSKKKG